MHNVFALLRTRLSTGRPLGVLLLAVQCGLGAGALLILGGLVISRIWVDAISTVFVLIGLLILLGVIAFLVLLGLGLWRLQIEAYWFSILLHSFAIAGGLTNGLDSGQQRWFNIAYSVLVIAYLLRPRVRRAFGLDDGIFFWLHRGRALLAVIFVGCTLIGLYNLYLAPPPSAARVRALVAAQHWPAVSSRDGTVLPQPDAQVQVKGVYALSWGAVSVYHTEQMQGSMLLKRSPWGWQDEGGSWGPIETVDQTGPLFVADDAQFDGVHVAALVMGRAKLPRVATVAVTFDDGTVLRDTTDGSHFAVVAEGHGGACLVQALDAGGSVLAQRTLQPRVVTNQTPADYDCMEQ